MPITNRGTTPTDLPIGELIAESSQLIPSQVILVGVKVTTNQKGTNSKKERITKGKEGDPKSRAGVREWCGEGGGVL